MKTTSTIATRTIIGHFAKMTGDFSPLHVDENFGQNSSHGKNLAHGMLPVFYALLSDFTRKLAEASLFPETISGRFSSPLYPDEPFYFKFETEQGESIALAGLGHNLSIVFVGIKQNSATEFYRGRISLCRVDQVSVEMGNSQTITNKEESSLEFFPNGLQLDSRFADEIRKGESEDFLAKVLTQIPEEFQLGLSHPWINYAQMTTTLSPLVGMRCPGSTATFQDFVIKFSKFVVLRGGIRITRKVSFISATVRTVVQTAQMFNNGGLIGSAQFSAAVAKRDFLGVSMLNLKKNHSSFDFSGKVALVSGGSRGIGATIAKLLALSGCKVIVNYRSNAEAANSVVSEINKMGGCAKPYKADISDENQVARLFQEILQDSDFGRIDFLVNNAVSHFAARDWRELGWSDMQGDIDVIVKGAFLLTKNAALSMSKTGGGAVVNIATIATDIPPWKQIKYVTAKSALVGLTRSFAVDLAAHNIRVNAVVPSMVETDLTRAMSPLALAEQKSLSPFKRLADPKDVASAVLFLLSDMSSYVTGQRIFVNGGAPPFV